LTNVSGLLKHLYWFSGDAKPPSPPKILHWDFLKNPFEAIVRLDPDMRWNV